MPEDLVDEVARAATRRDLNATPDQRLDDLREELRRCVAAAADALGRRLDAIETDHGRRLTALGLRTARLEQRKKS